MTHRIRSEEGNVIITAMLVMMLLLSLAFTTVQLVDTQQKESRRERERESGFQLSEAVLGAEIFQLSRRWPGKLTVTPYPVSCTQATSGSDCPSATALSGGFVGNPDYTTTSTIAGQNTTWTVQVRDNADSGDGSRYYSDATVLSRPRYDANDDQLMWVRAQGVVRGHRRTLVALVKAELITLPPLARKTLVAGHFDVSNAGNKGIINNGTSLGGGIQVRCGNGGYPTTQQPPTNGCAVYDQSKSNAQVYGDGGVYSNPSLPDHMLTPEALDALRERAASDGQLVPLGCPNWSTIKPGSVVFLEDANGCKLNSNVNVFTAAEPGVLVINKGDFWLNGTGDFYGIIYHYNADEKNTDLVHLTGTGHTYGGVIVDGNGGVEVGSSKDNLIFSPNAFNNVKGYGTAGIVQNTFREISATN